MNYTITNIVVAERYGRKYVYASDCMKAALDCFSNLRCQAVMYLESYMREGKTSFMRSIGTTQFGVAWA